MSERITLAVPYHSNLPYLEETLGSILAQNDTRWECIVCDDSAQGEAKDVVQRMNSPRLRWIRNPNPSGMSANWNFCFDNAATRFVSLVHADDRLLPRYVSTVFRLMESQPNAVAYFTASEVIGTNGSQVFSFPDFIKRFLEPRKKGTTYLQGESGAVALLRGNFIMCPTLCYDRKQLGSFRFSSQYRMVQDLCFTLSLLKLGFSLAGTSEKAYQYRRHTQNASEQMTQTLYRFREEAALYDQFSDIFCELGWRRAAETARGKRILIYHVLYRLAGDIAFLRWGRIAAKIQILRMMIWGEGIRVQKA